MSERIPIADKMIASISLQPLSDERRRCFEGFLTRIRVLGATSRDIAELIGENEEFDRVIREEKITVNRIHYEELAAEVERLKAKYEAEPEPAGDPLRKTHPELFKEFWE